MNDEPIDFSPLDPSRDAARWERMVQAVAARGQAARAQSVPLWLLKLGRPALLAAAAIAVLCWAPTLLRGRVADATSMSPQAGLQGKVRGSGSTQAKAQQSPALQLSAWAANDELPATAELLSTLGDGDGR
ncbi:MAG: hypothetical protein JST92_26270 [Deltaproteobacteria bacterium]|nr:hypothetical protein [Deltaproteobacteria bacterium]